MEFSKWLDQHEESLNPDNKPPPIPQTNIIQEYIQGWCDNLMPTELQRKIKDT